MDDKKKPLNIRVGRGVKASIWTNAGKHGDYPSVTLARTYQDSGGNLQDTDSFDKSDLLYVAYAAVMAYAHCDKAFSKK